MDKGSKPLNGSKNMKYVLLYFAVCLMDAFYVGSAVWLVLDRGWSKYVILLAIILAIISYPYRFLEAMKEADRNKQ